MNTLQADSISDLSKDNFTRGINISVGGKHFDKSTKKTNRSKEQPYLSSINENDIFRGTGGQMTLPERRAMSLVRGSINATDLLSQNRSLLHSNASSSNILDTSKDIKQKRSLNFIMKKREAERIDAENQQFLKKLNSLSVSPHLDTKMMKRQYKEVKKYKKTIQGTSNRF